MGILKFTVRDSSGKTIPNPNTTRNGLRLPDGSVDSLTEAGAIGTLAQIELALGQFPLKIIQVDPDGTQTVLASLVLGDVDAKVADQNSTTTTAVDPAVVEATKAAVEADLATTTVVAAKTLA